MVLFQRIIWIDFFYSWWPRDVILRHSSESPSVQVMPSLASSHYQNQCWILINWTLKKTCRNVNQDTQMFFQKHAFENVFSKNVGRHIEASLRPLMWELKLFHVSWHMPRAIWYIDTLMAITTDPSTARHPHSYNGTDVLIFRHTRNKLWCFFFVVVCFSQWLSHAILHGWSLHITVTSRGRRSTKMDRPRKGKAMRNVSSGHFY